MTTIAWRDGVLAADSQTTTDTLKGNWPKLFSLKDGGAVAFCGDYGAGLRFVRAMQKANDYVHRQGEDFTAIVMRPNGSAQLYENGLLQGFITDRFYAVGSGAMAALGAMCAGATARGAVQAAAQYDCHTGGRVRAIKAKGKRK